jgi:uncharacterized repeat protein (TIGR02543 family)
MPAEDVTITAKWKVNKYTITYKVDGKIYGEVETYDFGTEISIRPVPIKEGYTFSGWNIQEFPSKMPANNLEISGTFTINSYTITFDSAGGSEVASITQDYGTAITAPADPTKEGYTFVGWEPALPTTMPAEDVTITAKWTINQYTITFNTDGGSSIAPITVDYGAAIIAPADPTKTGYTFAGWDKEIPTTMPAEDVTITAKWKVNKYTITYKVDGKIYGEVETYDFGTEISIRPVPIKEGYTFSGWNIQEFPSKMPANNLEISGTSTTIWLILRSLDFEDMVFISLNISCTRKSHLRPTASSNASNSFKCSTWLFKRTISSVILVLSENIATSCNNRFSSSKSGSIISIMRACNFLRYSASTSGDLSSSSLTRDNITSFRASIS